MFKIGQTLTTDPQKVWQTLKNFDDPKTYRQMDSRKRTMYISKKKFTERSETALEKRKLCEKGFSSLEEFQALLDNSKYK